ncbi:MAG TPA: PIN domain-containing protein [Pirellulales bacterium]|jgi:hypothetical protein|nr:PIN domain-containing protein [Pirellulales bacterium]
MIFVDTGAWFAALVPDDAYHSAAAEFLRSNDEALVTTDYILDELLTLLKARGQLARAEFFIPQALSNSSQCGEGSNGSRQRMLSLHG